MTEASSTQVIEEEQHEASVVARPLNVLAALIEDDLDAAEKAGMEYYRAAGEKLIEARDQAEHGQFGKWIKDNFGISRSTAFRYMTMANPNVSRVKHFKSQNEFFRQREPKKKGPRPTVDIDIAAKDAREQREESEQRRKLALELIDAGFKALAKDLHPDAGGTSESMTRLNAVRDEMKKTYAKRTGMNS